MTGPHAAEERARPLGVVQLNSFSSRERRQSSTASPTQSPAVDCHLGHKTSHLEVTENVKDRGHHRPIAPIALRNLVHGEYRFFDLTQRHRRTSRTTDGCEGHPLMSESRRIGAPQRGPASPFVSSSTTRIARRYQHETHRSVYHRSHLCRSRICLCEHIGISGCAKPDRHVWSVNTVSTSSSPSRSKRARHRPSASPINDRSRKFIGTLRPSLLRGRVQRSVPPRSELDRTRHP